MCWNLPEGNNSLPGGPDYEEPEMVCSCQNQEIWYIEETGCISMTIDFYYEDKNDCVFGHPEFECKEIIIEEGTE